MRAPTSVAPGSRVTTHVVARPRSFSASGRPASTCRRPRRPRRRRRCRCRATGSAGCQRAAAHRTPEVGEDGYARLVVHLAEGADAGDDPDDAGGEQQQPGRGDGRRRDADAELARTADADQHAGHDDREHQHDRGRPICTKANDPAAHRRRRPRRRAAWCRRGTPCRRRRRRTARRPTAMREVERDGQDDHRAAGQHDAHAEPAAPGQLADDHAGRARCRAPSPMKIARRAGRTRRRRRRARRRRSCAVPITMPPPANAPKMPSTRPRTSGVRPMNASPR